MDNTKVCIHARDGRQVIKEFDSYEAAVTWIHEQSEKLGIKLKIDEARFDKQPTIEIYSEVPADAGREGV